MSIIESYRPSLRIAFRAISVLLSRKTYLLAFPLILLSLLFLPDFEFIPRASLVKVYSPWRPTSNEPDTNSSEPQPSLHLNTSEPSAGVIDYTDPFDVTRDVFYGKLQSYLSLILLGPWKAKIQDTVIAGEEFTMEFYCTYPDTDMCPPYYMVLFHGPSRQSVLPDAFTSTNWTFKSPHEYAVVRANWTIHDPGMYNVYVYPQFVYCKQWKGMDWPWQKATVQGSPFQLTVQSRRVDVTIPADAEGYETCTSEEIDQGRYLSTNASISNPRFAAMYEGSGRNFVWAPYKCKVPTRNAHQALDLIPTGKHFLFIGDSLTRGGFCTWIWEYVHGSVDGSVCDFKNAPSIYWDMKWGHKFTSVILEKNENRSEERNISFSFLWVAHNFDTVLPTLLSLTDPPPTHVVFNMGLYVYLSSNMR